MKIKSALITEASGSVGGLTASHNRGGLYFRARTIPVNPNSTFQQTVRTAMAALTSHWLNTLTAVQREAWDNYAALVPLVDPLGEERNVGGIAMYIRSNVPRLQAGLPQQNAAPVIFNLGDYTEPVIGVISAGGATLSLAFTQADAWCDEDDSAMLVAISRGVNDSINYFKGPYRHAGKVDGDAITPPTSPASITLPFTVAVDQRVFAKVHVSRADGRLSATFRGHGTVIV